jgi:hypothetical protein
MGMGVVELEQHTKCISPRDARAVYVNFLGVVLFSAESLLGKAKREGRRLDWPAEALDDRYPFTPRLVPMPGAAKVIDLAAYQRARGAR